MARLTALRSPRRRLKTEVQPFATTYETAFAFYNSLTEEQQAQLYQGESVSTMVCAPGSTCDHPMGTGIAGSDLTVEQKQLLLDVITKEYANSVTQQEASGMGGGGAPAGSMGTPPNGG